MTPQVLEPDDLVGEELTLHTGVSYREAAALADRWTLAFVEGYLSGSGPVNAAELLTELRRFHGEALAAELRDSPLTGDATPLAAEQGTGTGVDDATSVPGGTAGGGLLSGGHPLPPVTVNLAFHTDQPTVSAAVINAVMRDLERRDSV